MLGFLERFVDHASPEEKAEPRADDRDNDGSDEESDTSSLNTVRPPKKIPLCLSLTKFFCSSPRKTL
jgi:hypothetical protein